MASLKRGRGTVAVHGAGPGDADHAAIVPALHMSTTWRFESTEALRAHLRGDAPRLEYARYGNPTVRDVEERIAALEGAEDAILCASGMGALSTTFLALLGQGRHVVFTDDGYRPSRMLVEQVLSRFGVSCSTVPVDAPEQLAEVGRPGETRVVFTELPTNPHLRVPDLAAIRAAMKPLRGARLVVDATLATPWNAQVLSQGADLVLHSATKFMAGHNDVTAGAVAGSAPLVSALREVRGLLGTTADPHGAWLVQRGLRSLGARMEVHNRTASRLAERLQGHPRVSRVHYPGLLDGELPEWMRGGGGLLAFEVAGGRAAAGAVVDRCRLIQHAASLGGPESLIQQPAEFSFADLDDAALEQRGLSPGLLRLSVGLESEADLWDDLEQALEG